MKKAEVIAVINNGCSPIVRSVMSDGRYFAEKTSDEYTVLQKSGDAWGAINSTSEAKKNESVIVLNDCKDAKTGTKRTIAVNEEFMAWPLGTGFSFTVKAGKTILSLKQLTKAELKAVVTE
jgi:hypothetical protein